jgi:uncharacterized protein YjiS (DUF1127 family)
MIMSMTATAEAREQANGGALATAVAALKRLGAAYVSWRMEQSALVVLRSLSDRELKDIGLARSEISSAVRNRNPQDRSLASEY